jgi:hypothetical protein
MNLKIKRQDLKTNLLTNFNKANNEDINEEIVDLVNNCKRMINNIEQMNESYIKEVKFFINYYQSIFQKTFPKNPLTPTNINKEEATVEQLITFIERIKKNIDEGTLPENIEIDHLIMRSARKTRKQLIDSNESSSKHYQKVVAKNKQLYLASFQQLYLIKENGILSQTYFSKFDNNFSSNFCEIVCYFNIRERFSDVKAYIQSVRKWYRRFVILYRQDFNKSFTKVIVSGVTLKQAKKKLVKFVMNDVRENCLVKFSNFSRLKMCFDTVVSKLKKGYYYFSTNFAQEKFISLLEINK